MQKQSNCLSKLNSVYCNNDFVYFCSTDTFECPKSDYYYYHYFRNICVDPASCVASSKGNVRLLNGIQKGDSLSQRTGDEIEMHSVHLELFASAFTSTQYVLTPGADGGFWALVLDTQSNGTIAQFSTIFDTSSSAAGLAFKINSPRFRIIAREEWTVGAGMPYRARRDIAFGNSLPVVYSNITNKDSLGTFSCLIPIREALLFCWGSTVNSMYMIIPPPFFYNIQLSFTDICWKKYYLLLRYLLKRIHFIQKTITITINFKVLMVCEVRIVRCIKQDPFFFPLNKILGFVVSNEIIVWKHKVTSQWVHYKFKRVKSIGKIAFYRHIWWCRV